jgi:hypothetical protein
MTAHVWHVSTVGIQNLISTSFYEHPFIHNLKYITNVTLLQVWTADPLANIWRADKGHTMSSVPKCSCLQLHWIILSDPKCNKEQGHERGNMANGFETY